MSWVRLDDKFAGNLKIVQLTDAEFRVWVRLLCHCAAANDPTVDSLTRREVAGLTLPRCRRYAAVGLLDDHTTVGNPVRKNVPVIHEVHDWLIYQPKDPTNHERQQRWRSRNHAGLRPQTTVTDTVTPTVTQTVTETVTPRARASFPVPVTRKDPEVQNVSEGSTYVRPSNYVANEINDNGLTHALVHPDLFKPGVLPEKETR